MMSKAVPSAQRGSLISSHESRRSTSKDSNAGGVLLQEAAGVSRETAAIITTLDKDALKTGAGDLATSPCATSNDNAVATGGMRREWNFSLSFVHKAARLQVQWVPQWEPTFIDPFEIQKLLGEMDPDVTHSPLIPFLQYTDLSAVVHGRPRYHTRSKTSSQPVNFGSETIDDGEGLEKVGASGNTPGKQLDIVERTFTSREGVGNSVEGGSVLDECWVEKAKYVEAYYAPIVPQFPSLYDFCLRCVKFVLAKMQVCSVDGDTNLRQLRVGSKLACPYRLGGVHPCFHFRFGLSNKSELTNDVAYGIGTVVNQIGYFFVVRCADEEELCGYLTTLFLPYYTNKARLRLNVDVTYHEIPSVLLAEQQELFGELLYDDRDAAVSFYFPMYPMTLRPDFSPAKTVAVGSIACMTLELHLRERLLEDPALEELTGLQRYVLYDVVVCLDVEDVTRMNYPSVLSTDQFSELKMRRLLDVFPDATLIGPPATVEIGGRTGRSHLLTFFHEPMQCVVKAMVVSVLVGSYGVTGLYLAKHRNGGFGMHLYLFQHLLMGVRYYEQKSARQVVVSRDLAPNVRLLEADVEAAYAHAAGTPEGAKMLAWHLRLMREREATRHDKAKDDAAIEMGDPSDGVRGEAEGQAEGEGEGGGEGGDEAAEAATAAVHRSSLMPGTGGAPKGGGAAHNDRSWLSARVSVVRLPSNPDCDTVSIPYDGTTGAQHRKSPRFSDGRDSSQKSIAYFMSMSTQMYSAASAFYGRETNTSTAQHAGISLEKPLCATERAASVGEYKGNTELATLDSLHSQSFITVSCIPRLQDEYHDNDESEQEASSMEKGSTVALTKCESASQKSMLENLTTEAETAVATQSSLDGVEMSSHQCGPELPNHDDNSSEALHPPMNDGGDGVDTDIGDAPLNPPSDEGQALESRPACSSLEKSDVDGQNSIDEGEVYLGPSLRDVYTHCCDLQHCRPNSHLLKKLPIDPQFTDSVQEIDLTSNYVGHNGFVAVLGLLEYLHKLRRVVFDDMSLDNVDAVNLCGALMVHPSVESVSLRNNPKITLPSTPHFSRLVKGNPRITCLVLEGTLLGEAVVQRLGKAAAGNKCPPECNDVGREEEK